MRSNIILATDSYKVSHYKQYPPDTEVVYSYFESRGGEFNEIVFFGLQYILDEFLSGEVVTPAHIDEAEEVCAQHFGSKDLFNRKGWELLVNEHGGQLPVKIKAVPEGSVLPPHNVLCTIENTDPRFYWLPNYLETLLVQLWYPCTVATQSRKMKKIILKYLHDTGDPSLIDYKLHDFGFRGVSSVESAGIGGAAHLVSFKGTDTMQALLTVNENYGSSYGVGNSIPAAEHSTMTSWGRDHEVDAMRNMLEQYPTGLVACVSDSYNIFDACDKIWGDKLKDMVLSRDGTLVVRPDSGDPPTTVVNCLNILGAKLGQKTNAKGYKVLNPKVRLIQGDGIDIVMLEEILHYMKQNHWSADNIAFGSGGGLLQKLNRDTCKFAFKCSAVKRSGEWHDVYKEPVTDPGKNSKRGRLMLASTVGAHGIGYQTIQFHDEHKDMVEDLDCMKTVFENGEIKERQRFDCIRQRAKVV